MERVYDFFESEFTKDIKLKETLFARTGLGIRIYEDIILNLAIYNSSIHMCQEELRGLTYKLPSFFIYKEGIQSNKIRLNDYIKDYYFILEGITQQELYLYYIPIIGEGGNRLFGWIFFLTYNELKNEELNFLQTVSKKFTNLIKDYFGFILPRFHLDRWVKSILYMLNGYDTYTYYHSMRVADFARIIAYEMEMDSELIYISGLIHDLGKLWIPKEILYKKGKLTKEEFNIVKLHPKKLEEIFWGNYQIRQYVEIAKYHHEKLDGTGYYGLKGDEIPMESRVLIVADIIDAMLNDRPYRSALPLERVIRELRYLADNGKIDKEITEKTIPFISNYYIGSIGASRKLGLAISKSITIHYIEKGESKIVSAIVESTSKNVINISVAKKIKLPVGYKIYVEYMVGGDLKRLKAVVINQIEGGLSIKITKESKKERVLRIFWRIDIKVAPVPFIPDGEPYFRLKKDLQSFGVKAYTKVVGGDFLSFIISRDKDIFHLGEAVVVEMSPLHEEIIITGIITHKVAEFESHVEYWVEYVKLSEKTYGKVYKAIFRRQIEMKFGLKKWTK